MNETWKKTTLDKLMHCTSEAFNVYIIKNETNKGQNGLRKNLINEHIF